MIRIILMISQKIIKEIVNTFKRYFWICFSTHFRCAMVAMTVVTCRMSSLDALVSFSKNFNFNFQRNRDPVSSWSENALKLFCALHPALASIKNIKVAIPKLFPSSKLSILRVCKNSHILRTILWSIIIKVLRDEAWPSLASLPFKSNAVISKVF